METVARGLNVGIRVCGGAALLLGFALWLGYARQLIRLHIALGIALVLALWALAGILWTRANCRSLAVWAIAWGIATWMLGIMHTQMLGGPRHWIIQVVHLATGATLIALGGRLVDAIVPAPMASPTSAASGTRDMT